VTHNSTRKQFFAKLLGVVAATSVFPKLFANPVARTPSASAEPAGSSANTGFAVRHDRRTIARRDIV
jgi:hypothetical protein